MRQQAQSALSVWKRGDLREAAEAFYTVRQLALECKEANWVLEVGKAQGISQLLRGDPAAAVIAFQGTDAMCEELEASCGELTNLINYSQTKADPRRFPSGLAVIAANLRAAWMDSHWQRGVEGAMEMLRDEILSEGGEFRDLCWGVAKMIAADLTAILDGYRREAFRLLPNDPVSAIKAYQKGIPRDATAWFRYHWELGLIAYWAGDAAVANDAWGLVASDRTNAERQLVGDLLIRYQLLKAAEKTDGAGVVVGDTWRMFLDAYLAVVTVERPLVVRLDSLVSEAALRGIAWALSQEITAAVTWYHDRFTERVRQEALDALKGEAYGTAAAHYERLFLLHRLFGSIKEARWFGLHALVSYLAAMQASAADRVCNDLDAELVRRGEKTSSENDRDRAMLSLLRQYIGYRLWQRSSAEVVKGWQEASAVFSSLDALDAWLLFRIGAVYERVGREALGGLFWRLQHVADLPKTPAPPAPAGGK